MQIMKFKIRPIRILRKINLSLKKMIIHRMMSKKNKIRVMEMTKKIKRMEVLTIVMMKRRRKRTNLPKVKLVL